MLSRNSDQVQDGLTEVEETRAESNTVQADTAQLSEFEKMDVVLSETINQTLDSDSHSALDAPESSCSSSSHTQHEFKDSSANLVKPGMPEHELAPIEDSVTEETRKNAIRKITQIWPLQILSSESEPAMT